MIFATLETPAFLINIFKLKNLINRRMLINLNIYIKNYYLINVAFLIGTGFIRPCLKLTTLLITHYYLNSLYLRQVIF